LVLRIEHRWREALGVAAHLLLRLQPRIKLRTLYQRCLSTLKQRRENYVGPTERAQSHFSHRIIPSFD